MGTIVNQIHKYDVTYGNKYQVILLDIEHSSHEMTYNVDTIICPSKNFEEFGWFCYHIIRILHMFSIVR